MTRVIFLRSQRMPSGAFFLVDGADVGLTCCVSARLQLENVEWNAQGNEENAEFDFCVECKHVLTAIDPSSTGGSLTLTQGLAGRDGDGAPPGPRARGLRGRLRALDLRRRRRRVTKGRRWTSRSSWRSISRRCARLEARKSHAEILRIRVYTHDSGSKKYSLACFSVRGDNQRHDQKFCHEINYHEDGSMVVRAAADGETRLFETLAGTPLRPRPVDKIESCRKEPADAHDARQDQVRSADDAVAQPRGANDDTQHIRFLVASTNEDVDDD